MPPWIENIGMIIVMIVALGIPTVFLVMGILAWIIETFDI